MYIIHLYILVCYGKQVYIKQIQNIYLENLFIFKMDVLTALLYVSETWTMSVSPIKTSRAFPSSIFPIHRL